MRHVLFITSAIAMAVTAMSVSAEDYTISVTLDTGPQHVRNVWLKEFADQLKEKTDGQLQLEIFEAAAKYKDSEAAAAVAQGAIDMAIPQYQLISRFVPESDFEQLPVFYGVDRAKIYEITDGPIGDDLHNRIQDKLKVKVVGRPIDLGFGSVFSTDTELTSPEDLAGLKVRVPGGPATIQRYEAMGSAPVQISWPDVPQALQTGTITALWSTQESVASAKLWDAGVKYALNDRQAIVQYLPLMNQASFDKLPEELQTTFLETWDSMVDGQRDLAASKQDEAQATNGEHGISTSTPTEEQSAAMRSKLMEIQPSLVEELGMDPTFVDALNAALGN